MIGKSSLSRCIENAEFMCALEEWKGYIIGTVDGEYRFCPLSNKQRDRYGDNTIVVRLRKDSSSEWYLSTTVHH